jgi:hypothetical protein
VGTEAARPQRAGGADVRGGAAGGTEPKTFIAVATIPARSDTVAGTMTEFACFADLTGACL